MCQKIYRNQDGVLLAKKFPKTPQFRLQFPCGIPVSMSKVRYRWRGKES